MVSSVPESATEEGLLVIKDSWEDDTLVRLGLCRITPSPSPRSEKVEVKVATPSVAQIAALCEVADKTRPN